MQYSKLGMFKGVLLVNRRYKRKGYIYKRERGWTLGRRLPVENIVEYTLRRAWSRIEEMTLAIFQNVSETACLKTL